MHTPIGVLLKPLSQSQSELPNASVRKACIARFNAAWPTTTSTITARCTLPFNTLQLKQAIHTPHPGTHSYSLRAIHRQELLAPYAPKSTNEPTKSPGESAGAKSYRGRTTASSISHQLPLELCSNQNLIDQLLIRPVSPLALSLTRSFQLPLSTSLDRFTVKVCLMSSALPPA